MAVTTNTHISTDVATAVINAVYKIAHKIEKHIARMNTVTTLSKLSDRDLEDIGLTRADIPFVAKELLK